MNEESRTLWGNVVLGWAWPASERSRTSHLVLDQGGQARTACGAKAGAQIESNLRVAQGYLPCQTCVRHHVAHLGPVRVSI